MVPLRLDVCDDRSRLADVRSRPPLVLKDLTAERPPAIGSALTRRSPLHRLENILLAAAAAAVLLYFFFMFALSLVHAVQQSYVTPALPSVPCSLRAHALGDNLTLVANKRYS